MARGCARIDSRLDTAKIGSDGRVDVDYARLRAVLGEEKRFHTAWVISADSTMRRSLPIFPYDHRQTRPTGPFRATTRLMRRSKFAGISTD